MDVTASPVSRSKEDIALDLLKFVAGTTNVGRTSTSAPGFGIPSAPKSEDQVSQILDLYARCRQAVEAPLGK